jgi:hypothetical protein
MHLVDRIQGFIKLEQVVRKLLAGDKQAEIRQSERLQKRCKIGKHASPANVISGAEMPGGCVMMQFKLPSFFCDPITNLHTLLKVTN